MKHIRQLTAAAMIVLLAGCSGCYTPAKYPLQPGEKIIFRDAGRANEFRMMSGNDPAHGGAVVEVTRPTLVLCE